MATKAPADGAPGGEPGTLSGKFMAIDSLFPALYSKYKKVKARQLATYGLTQQQATILLLVERSGPMKVGDIATELSMVDSNVSNICSRLEKMGYVHRHRLPHNQRVVNIELTEMAKGKLASIKATTKKYQGKIQRHTSTEAINEIYAGLARMDILLDAMLEGED